MLEDVENSLGLLNLRSIKIDLQMMKDNAHDLEVQVLKMEKKKIKSN